MASCVDIAKVAELVDALDLGSSAARRGGSSPPFRTRPGRDKFCVAVIRNAPQRVERVNNGLFAANSHP